MFESFRWKCGVSLYYGHGTLIYFDFDAMQHDAKHLDLINEIIDKLKENVIFGNYVVVSK